MLKAQYDAGRDHIDMFMPFIADALSALGSQRFVAGDVQRVLTERHGLSIPLNTLATLLSRAARRGTIRQDHHNFIVTAALPSTAGLDARRVSAEAAIQALAGRLREYARAAGLPVANDDQAVRLLLTFLGANQPDLLLNHFDSASAAAVDGLSRVEARVTARFIEGVALEDAGLKEALANVLEGLVLQNALLLRDIADASRQFVDLRAFLDSYFLLGALGFAGSTTQQSFREALDILRDTGVRLEALERTVDEMKRILAVYEGKLGTALGRESLHPTEITRHLLTTNITPADIREAIGLMNSQIGQLGVKIRTAPPRDRAYTLNESDLADRLRRPYEDKATTRIQHDIDAVAAVLVLRRGRLATRLENAQAVFVTTNSSVVATVNEWYADAGEQGVSPVVHQRALTNAAWLKKPAAAEKLMLHELVALCAAALRPSRRIWDAFLVHLRHLEERGTISTDEAAVIVASELTDRLLADCGDTTLEEESVTAISDRVIATFRADADRAVVAAEQRATRAEEAHRSVFLRWVGRADSCARVLAWVPILALVTAFASGVAVGIPTVWDSLPTAWQPAGRVAATAAAFIACIAIYNGFHLRAMRLGLEAKLRTPLRRWFVGPETARDD